MTPWDKFLLKVFWYIPGSVSKTIQIANRYWGSIPIDRKESGL